MIGDIKKQLREYEIKSITKLNYKQSMDIFKTNNDFFILTEGHPATEKSCIKNITIVPPDFNIANKYYLSIWKNDSAIAVLDFLIGYPKSDCIWLGLLLIRGELKGKGIGSKIADAIFKAFKAKEFKSVQLGVVEENSKALKFWSKFGFTKIRETKAGVPVKENTNIFVMEKIL